MKLHIDDSTNSAKELYFQSLVLLFLPCEKFGENDTTNSLYVKAFQENGKNYVDVTFNVDAQISSCSDVQDIDNKAFSQMKNLIGRTILKAAFKLFRIVPPWGISTGVKPVKFARIFVQAFGADEAERILRDEYMVLPHKAKMAVYACLFEDSIMENMGDKACSLYVSIPFCPTKCNYCSFVSCTTPRLLSLIPQYLEALDDELQRIADTINELELNLKSIYVGGGTPAILSAREIDKLLSSVYSKFSFDNRCEFTFEAGRPDCITEDKLKVLSQYNVPRISINTQTTNDSVLKSIGRNHTSIDYFKVMESAMKFGFKCINTDLIAGLPGESPESFFKSLRDVEAFSPQNITVHSFTLKRSSNYRMGGETGYSLSFEDAVNMTDYASQYMLEKGYNPYYVYRQKNTIGNLENVGYSVAGFESIYNIIMMGEYHTVFGAGAGSVTKIVSEEGNRVDRIFSPKYPYEFLDKTKYSGFDKDGVFKIIRER